MTKWLITAFWVAFLLFVLVTLTCLVILFLRTSGSKEAGPRGPSGIQGPVGPVGSTTGPTSVAQPVALVAYLDPVDGAQFVPPPSGQTVPRQAAILNIVPQSSNIRSVMSQRIASSDPKYVKDVPLMYHKTGNIVTLAGHLKVHMTEVDISRFRVHIQLPDTDPILSTVPYRTTNPNVVSFIGNAWTEYSAMATRANVLLSDVLGGTLRDETFTAIPDTQNDLELILLFNVTDKTFFHVPGDTVPVHVYFHLEYISKTST